MFFGMIFKEIVTMAPFGGKKGEGNGMHDKEDFFSFYTFLCKPEMGE